MSDTDRLWSRLQRYRRLYKGSAAVLLVALVLLSLRPATRIVAGAGAALAVVAMLWAIVQLGATSCPQCGYRLRGIDALSWKRCRQCGRSLTRVAA